MKIPTMTGSSFGRYVFVIDWDPSCSDVPFGKVLRTLRSMRAKNDIRGVLGVLETCIRTNFAGIESPRYVCFDLTAIEHGIYRHPQAIQRGS